MQGRGRDSGRLSSKALARQDLEERVLALRRAGRTFDEIASEAGFANRGVAYKYLERALARHRNDDVEHLRAVELERSDALIARLWPLVDREDPDVAALDRLLRVMDYRARVAGLYAPRRQEVGVDVRAVAAGTPESVMATAMLDELLDELVAQRHGTIDV